MNAFKKQVGIAAVLVLGMLVGGIASATPTVMTFDGMTNAKNGEYVANYYDGGCGDSYNGGAVDCDGPDYGVVWDGLVAGGAPDGFWDDAANQPSAPMVGGFRGPVSSGPRGAKGLMNVAAGFDTGFSFYYSAPQHRGQLRIYSGVNGTGTILVNTFLPKTGARCEGFSEEYSCWQTFGVSFNGIARSVVFLGRSNDVLFDNFTLGSTTPLNPTPVPEPAALGMFEFGVLLIGGVAALRRRVHPS